MYLSVMGIQQQMVNDSPDHVEFSKNLAVTQRNLGNIEFRQQNFDRAAGYYTESRKRLTQLGIANQRTDIRLDIAALSRSIGDCFFQTAEKDQAKAEYITAKKYYKLLSEKVCFEQLSAELGLLRTSLTMGQIEQEQQEYARARKEFESILTTIEALPEEHKRSAAFLDIKAVALSNQALVLVKSENRVKKAERLTQEAIGIAKDLNRRYPKTKRFANLLDQLQTQLRLILNSSN